MTSPAKAKLDAIGIDAICDRLSDGETMTRIAEAVGVSIGTLISWVNDDSERSARAREARILSARIWDEKAEHGIELASDAFELSRAKELAHHYRWRAAKIAPKDYGDKVSAELSGPNGGPVPVSVTVELVCANHGADS